ncbi:MAG TPA: hypothetical protein VJ045_00940, partial [Hyphomicrobiaceae bacterium]|nr:hypothetical protein [Hyphomicrobiaceae bacterium]
IAQSDRVAAELNRELFLIGRADAAISYLRTVREQAAVQVAALLEQRAMSTLPPLNRPRESSRPNGFGVYDPNWPQ